MREEDKYLLISGIITSLIFFVISAFLGGRRLIRNVFTFPRNEKLLMLCFLLGFLSALFIFLLYDTSEKFRRWIPYQVFEIIIESDFLIWCFVMVIASISEEVLFRGVLQQSVGIFLSNLLFGFLHFLAEKRFLFMGIFAFLFGILLSYIYSLTNILAYPILLHISHNFFSTLFIKYRGREMFN